MSKEFNFDKATKQLIKQLESFIKKWEKLLAYNNKKGNDLKSKEVKSLIKRKQDLICKLKKSLK